MKDIRAVLSLSIAYLEDRKIPRARLIAEMLLSHSLGIKRIDLYMQYDRPLNGEELDVFRSALKRAGKREPYEYILGEIEFYGAKIEVSPDVLIPRQETEILLDMISKRLRKTERRVLDLCTGSGCLAIGLKKAHPHLEITGIDISEAALSLARRSALKNGVDIEWLQGDLVEPVASRTFDLVLCNPPYLSEVDYQNLDEGVSMYEPKGALVGGENGYLFFDRLAAALPSVIGSGGRAFFEIGSSQGTGVIERFSKNVWMELCLEKDWAGHDRFFSLKRKEFPSIIGPT